MQTRILTKVLEGDVLRRETFVSKDRVALPLGYRSAVTPCWDPYENDTFAMRLLVIDRFVRAGTKCLVQLRASRRLKKLRAAMAEAFVTDRASCRTWVEAENKAAAVGGGDSGDDDKDDGRFCC